MAVNQRPRVDAGSLLAAAAAAPPVAAAEVVGRHLAELLGASDVSLLIADLSGRSLIRLGHGDPSPGMTRRQGEETAQRVAVDSSPGGRALVRQRVEVESSARGATLYAPVTNRGEAIGVLELDLPARPGRETLDEVALAADVLAYIIIANRRYTDLFEWGRRSRPLSVAAEIQHRLLPAPFTCEAGQATIAGWLEPAPSVAGDTFDFSLERDVLHLSITDAMGHDLEAALLATTAVGTLRNARRRGATLAEQADLVSTVLLDCAEPGQFVTGQLVRIDLRGRARIVNAGHPAPVRMRGGTAADVALDAQPPLGSDESCSYFEQELELRPGDRLFFVTDGVIDRNAASLDIGEVMQSTASDHPRDAVQALMRALLDETEGDLRDDATVLCLEWHGDERSRVAPSG